MKKITDLKETRFRTDYSKDKSGNRVKKTITYIASREVRVVEGGRRFAHYFVDLLVFQAIYSFFSFLLQFLPVPKSSFDFELMLGLFSISIFVLFLYPLYYFLFEFYFQKTVGKFLTKTSVIDVYGNKPSVRKLLLRSLIRIVPFEPFSCLRDRGWHDRWSDTYVVTDTELSTLKKLLDLPGDMIFPIDSMDSGETAADREALRNMEKHEEMIETFRKNYQKKSSDELVELLADKRFIQEAKDAAQQILNEREQLDAKNEGI
jgi:uncharacterized RDD family membrane protein YckC